MGSTETATRIVVVRLDKRLGFAGGIKTLDGLNKDCWCKVVLFVAVVAGLRIGKLDGIKVGNVMAVGSSLDGAPVTRTSETAKKAYTVPRISP